MDEMKILTFAGSLRKESLNKKLCQQVVNFLQAQKLADAEWIDLRDLEIPLYDEDIESTHGDGTPALVPIGVQKLWTQVQEADALILASPEYNGAISGVMKNTLDWISRKKPSPIAGKHVLFLAASQGALGGVRGLWHTRVPFEAVGCHVYPEMLGIPQAHQVFDGDGKIKDEVTKQRLEKLLQNFVHFLQ